MKNSLKPQKLTEFENYFKANEKICKSLLLDIENTIRLGRMKWGCLISCGTICLITTQDEKVGFSRNFLLPYNIALTYIKGRKELPLHMKL
jgi:hypothetical protein